MRNQNDLTEIPGVGPSIANDLRNIGITSINDLMGKNPEKLYEMSNKHEGKVQDKCLLYVFRCAVYYANKEEENLEEKKLEWWNWKDKE